MSLVKLLTQYPNYSARRVRRLATQIAYLEGINSKEAKGIADDLMEFNLLQARTEAQMNDDVQVAVPLPLAPIIQVPSMVPEAMAAKLYGVRGQYWEYVDTFSENSYNLVRENVTRTSEALRAIDHVVNMVEGLNEDHACVKSAKGIVYGHSFYTDRVFIKETVLTSPE